MISSAESERKDSQQISRLGHQSSTAMNTDVIELRGS
jgi:hypothetical protein